ncbi:MAG: DUF2244 domain-containing protein [Pseudomonadota bacterium]
MDARAQAFEDMPATIVGRRARPARGAEPHETDEPADDVVFRALLYPNRSLPNSGFMAVMAVVCGVNFIAGAYFMALGAWPVLGFCGLDIALVYGAFKLSYRQGRLHETIHITPDRMTVSRVSPAGLESRWILQPYWVRVAIDSPVEHHSQLRVTSHGKTLVLGAFLSPEERESLGEALAQALQKARFKHAGAAEQESTAE